MGLANLVLDLAEGDRSRRRGNQGPMEALTRADWALLACASSPPTARARRRSSSPLFSIPSKLQQAPNLPARRHRFVHSWRPFFSPALGCGHASSRYIRSPAQPLVCSHWRWTPLGNSISFDTRPHAGNTLIPSADLHLLSPNAPTLPTANVHQSLSTSATSWLLLALPAAVFAAQPAAPVGQHHPRLQPRP